MALTGALRKYYRQEGFPLNPRLHCAVAVSMHGVSSASTTTTIDLANNVGYPKIPLALSIEDDMERLAFVKQTSTILRRRGFGAMYQSGMTLLGYLPPWIGRKLFLTLSRACSVALSNTFGPGQTVRVNGNPVSRLVVLAPTGYEVGLSVSFTTYNNVAEVAFLGDSNNFHNPRSLPQFIEAEYERLASDV